MATAPQPNDQSKSHYIRSVCLKAVLLFVFANLLFAAVKPIPFFERWTAYNLIFPGRVRLPFGENPAQAYNLSLYQLDAMFESHAVAQPKAEDEFRVVLIGDSSVWGFLLQPEDTLSSLLNAAGMETADGRRVKVYNLGYPTISLTKDLLILDRAQHYSPDLVIWLTTLEAMPRSRQLDSPIVQNNAGTVRRLIQQYGLQLDPRDARLVDLNFWQETIIGRRRALADLLRLQFYGVMWAATGIDQFYPEKYEPPQHDLEADESFHEFTTPPLDPQGLSVDVLSAGFQLSSPVPVLLVNEPVYISDGENSDIRYNFFYPRWAYDSYRLWLSQLSQANHWNYLDAWDLVPAVEFTNSAIHYNQSGSALLAASILQAVEPLIR